MSTVDLADGAWGRLHEIRLKGMVQAVEDEDAAALVEAGYAAARGSKMVITSAGRDAHARWARLAEGSEEEAAARRAYDKFLALDMEMKQITTDWQLASGSSASGAYSADDWKLIDRLMALDERAGPALLRVGGAVARFAGYRPRLKEALTRLENGERQWFSGLTCDSYHTVWWQLHEDLLIALGIARQDDPNQ